MSRKGEDSDDDFPDCCLPTTSTRSGHKSHIPTSMQEPLCSAATKCKTILAAVCLVAAIVILCNIWTTIPAGHVGILDTFGKVHNEVLMPGAHFVAPWTDVHRLIIKTKIVAMTEDVPSREGLSVHLEAAALYRLKPEYAVEMYKQVGPNYEDVILTPQFRSILRSITSDHDAKDLYTSASRIVMTSDLRERLQAEVEAWGLVIESTPLKKISLPNTIQQAIEQKLKSEQETQRMDFVLAKEAKEAERKRVEAQGIQDFQNIVREGIDEHLLRWKGIEATEKLADSSNTKVIVIGSGSGDGLPVILNP